MRERLSKFWEYITSDGIIWAALAGVFVSLVTSESESPRHAITRVVCGVFCAVMFTEPLLDYTQRDPEVYQYALSGLLAMTGFQLVNALNSATLKSIVDLIRAIRGK